MFKLIPNEPNPGQDEVGGWREKKKFEWNSLLAKTCLYSKETTIAELIN